MQDMVHWKWAMVQHHAPRVPSRDPLAGCEVVGRKEAWSHFGAVPAFAEGGIHDSMGRWEWAPRGLGDPGAERRFRVEDAMHTGAHTNQQRREPPRGEGRRPGLISEPLMPVLVLSGLVWGSSHY